MKIEEAIRYFEQRVADCKEAEALATKRPELKDLAESCHYEREALCAALRAMRGADKALRVAKQALQTANQATQVARDDLFQDTDTPDAEIITQLRRVAIDRHCCLGCGHEHNCGIHGCAIIRAAIGRLERRNTDA